MILITLFQKPFLLLLNGVNAEFMNIIGVFSGTVLLDLEQFDIHSIVETIVENMVITDQLPRSEKDTVVDALLLKHRHQYQEEASIPRRPSFYNLKSFSQNVSKEDENHFPEQPDALKQEDGAICLKIDDSAGSDTDEEDHQKSHVIKYLGLFYLLDF